MSTNMWFISDTHFSHKNIIQFCRGEFSSIDEMNEYMIEQWNARIGPRDRVIHCGDIFFGSKNAFLENIAPRLNGHIELVIGNHDNPHFLVRHNVVHKIHMWLPLKKYGLLVSHVPLHQDQLFRGSYDGKTHALNIHGHIHEKESPEGPYRNICVEQTGFKPLHIDEIRMDLYNG